MRVILASLLVVIFVASPCSAQGDKAKPNTLTPKEIADGWILLFDGETTFGWTIEGTAKVENGSLVVGGAKPAFAKVSLPFTSHQIKIEFEALHGKEPSRIKFGDGTTLQILVALDDKGISKSIVNVPGEAGIPVSVSVPANSQIAIRNIKLRPLNTTPLFNGKDLTGWKTFAGDKYKSKFSVNDKGELNVKDGPGDLQTVGKYKDFILQLECISNGKHLNSGIFFRCRDNEYQNGYEAQIRNQFTKEPTQKYLIEEYDPKTNKLVGKKEILSTAFDFGTGAIYRRVPARKEMSKDGEWFSMTIAAQGNHFATWVNGVQVTDWTDNRPKSDNARTGCRLEGGHLSIQGHDPTTDLSFRNLRIAEMK